MLVNRLISICLLVPIILYMLFFSSIIQFSVFVCGICLMSAWEWGKMMHFSIKIFKIWMCTIFGLLCSLMIFTILKYDVIVKFLFVFYYFLIFIIIWWILVFFLTLFYPKFVVFWNKSNLYRFYFGILMILPFFCSMLVLRQFHYINGDIIGSWWLLYVMTLVWINDSSAYLIGRMFGRHKLLENVSPNKTWEGCIGGIVVSFSVSWLFSMYIHIPMIKPYILIVYSVSVILMSIVGDLVESMFKREAGIKDTSNLIPGHGGILDRIDSLSSSIPTFTCLILSICRH